MKTFSQLFLIQKFNIINQSFELSKGLILDEFYIIYSKFNILFA